MAEHIDLGKKGEDLACNYLLKEGYTILARNWRFLKREIDIIALDKKELVIVEVKTRNSYIYQEPRDSISRNKILFLTNAAEYYIYEQNIDSETRFDVISIKWYSENKYELEHIKDAFTPIISR